LIRTKFPALSLKGSGSTSSPDCPDTDDDFNDFTTPLLFVLGKKQLLTVSRDSLRRLWQPFIDSTRVSTAQQTKLFVFMMEAIATQYQSRVASINRQMRAVTSDITNLDPKDISTLVEYERKLNDYLDALIPANTALETLLNGKLLRLYDDDKDLVEDLSVDLEQVITRCKSLLRTIVNVRDSYRAVMDTRLNETIRLLTVITLALTIPTALAGLYGMNLNLPGNEASPHMFWVIVAISSLSAGALSYYFLKKR
jgi:magnesium transporter